jgi:chromosome segregation ATPase
MREATEQLEHSNRDMTDRFSNAQADASRLMREKNALAQEVSDLKERLDRAERAGESSRASASASARGREEDSSSRVRDLEDALADAREEGDRKVQDTAQFRQMKALMQTQAGKIRDLRYRLQRYEPDDAKDDDA